MEPITLASSSPRRKELLNQMGIPFVVITADIDETVHRGESVSEAVERLSRMKAEAVLPLLEPEKRRWVLGADTLIEFRGRPMGKPLNIREARKFMTSFSGTMHRVITGLTLYNGEKEIFLTRSDTTDVRFAPLDDGEIDRYLNSGEWKDAAGGYKVQGTASRYIEEVCGSYSNVMGLPIRVFYVMLKDNNYPFT